MPNQHIPENSEPATGFQGSPHPPPAPADGNAGFSSQLWSKARKLRETNENPREYLPVTTALFPARGVWGRGDQGRIVTTLVIDFSLALSVIVTTE